MASGLWEKWSAQPADSLAMVDLPSKCSLTFRDFAGTLARLYPGRVPVNGQGVALSEPNGGRWLTRFLFLQKHGCPAILMDAGLDERQAVEMAARCGAQWFWSESGEWIDTGAHTTHAPETAFVKVTSGSTGTPATFPSTSAQALADGVHVISTMHIRREDRQLGLIPFGHSYALGNIIMPWILQGTPIYTAGEATPGQIPDWIATYRLTVFPTVPIFIKLLVQSPSIRSLAPMRTVISAGAPLPKEVARQFHRKFGLFVHNFYGSSETGGICYDRSGEAGISGRSVGRPLDGVEVRVEPDGRIRVTSAAVLHDSGSFLLPDTGRWTPEGELELTGRLEPWANIGGKKVRPGEVAAVLEGLDRVDEAWVGVIDEGDRQWLRAVVATRRSGEDLRHELREQLPAWKVPREIRIVPQLPRTCRGKLDRQILERSSSRCRLGPNCPGDPWPEA